jgi:hypothetical protein
MKNILILLAMTLLVSCGFTNPEVSAGHEGYVVESPRVFGKGGFQATLVGPANFGFNQQILI